MKKMYKWLWIGLVVPLSLLAGPPLQVQAASSTTKGIEADKYEPTGKPEVGYPQIVIRIDHTLERTNLDEIIKAADEAADKYPLEDQENRAKAVTAKLNELLGSGSFGHAWIIIFHSAKPGDYTSYAYHGKYGFVKNGTASDKNDSPERKFHVERVRPFKLKTMEQLEQTLIPELNKESLQTAMIMGAPVDNPENGAYTPINNCSWFAGNYFTRATGDKLSFEQPFNGSEHGEYWGMPFLNAVTKIADPGIIAENIGK